MRKLNCYVVLCIVLTKLHTQIKLINNQIAVQSMNKVISWDWMERNVNNSERPARPAIQITRLEIVRPNLISINGTLNKQQTELLENLLDKHRKVFSDETSNTNIYRHGRR